MNWLDALLGKKRPRAPEVEVAMEKRDQDFADLDEALGEAKDAMVDVDKIQRQIIKQLELEVRRGRK